jgi:hypothetical protein
MNKTLNETLAQLGYTTQSGMYRKKYIIKNSVVVFYGNAHEVWTWLHATNQI